MRERPNRHAWKACEVKASVGSNPTPSAMSYSIKAAMDEAIALARIASERGEVPVGAVVLRRGEIIAARHNEKELSGDPTAHAEILALRDAAGALNTWNLNECDMVVSLEPCIMCAGALVNARLRSVYFGIADAKAGATGSLYNVCEDPRLNHQLAVTAGDVASSRQLLRDFFRKSRAHDSVGDSPKS